MRYLSYPKKYSTNEALESKDFYFLWCICVRIRKQVMGKPALTDKKKNKFMLNASLTFTIIIMVIIISKSYKIQKKNTFYIIVLESPFKLIELKLYVLSIDTPLPILLLRHSSRGLLLVSFRLPVSYSMLNLSIAAGTFVVSESPGEVDSLHGVSNMEAEHR